MTPIKRSAFSNEGKWFKGNIHAHTTVSDGMVAFTVACGKDAVASGANAGKIIKAVASHCGGGGGGRPASAQAGGKDASKVDEALAMVKDLI